MAVASFLIGVCFLLFIIFALKDDSARKLINYSRQQIVTKSYAAFRKATKVTIVFVAILYVFSLVYTIHTMKRDPYEIAYGIETDSNLLLTIGIGLLNLVIGIGILIGIIGVIRNIKFIARYGIMTDDEYEHLQEVTKVDYEKQEKYLIRRLLFKYISGIFWA